MYLWGKISENTGISCGSEIQVLRVKNYEQFNGSGKKLYKITVDERNRTWSDEYSEQKGRD